jgi:general secretion pathway protein C
MVNTLTGMTAQAFLHRYFPALYLASVVLLGSVAGWLAVVILGFRLSSPVESVNVAQTSQQAVIQTRSLSDYQIILSRDIFNADSASTSALSDTDDVVIGNKNTKKAAVPAKKFILVGTIAAGLNSLAVLQEGKETGIYRLGEEIEEGITVEKISRNTVVLVYRDGSRQTLNMTGDKEERRSSPVTAPPEKTTAAAKNFGVQQVGDNKWTIPKEVAEQTRNNVNELLKEARMEPRIVDGQTDGFVVRTIQANSFLAGIGLRRGDVLMAINSVQLNSPEKALQIFQQLREARDIRVDLLRNDQPVTLEFEID